MQNALSGMQGAPEAPSPQPQQMPDGNAMQGPAAAAQPSQGGAPGQQPPPPPSHQQTAAALKQFDALEQELTGLLSDPDLGKADMKSKIIDGATKLVAMGILTPAAAVTQLGSVPDKPFDQKAWLEQHLMQVVGAANGVLAHHGQAFAGQEPDNMTSPTMDGHIDTIGGLAGQYRGQQ